MQSESYDKAMIYNDVNQLNSLKHSKYNNREGLKNVAKQFEALYLNMMMQSMRKAERVWSEDSLFSSKETQFYEDMMDNQLSVNLSQERGIGLADMIIKQFDRFVTNGRKDEPQVQDNIPQSVKAPIRKDEISTADPIAAQETQEGKFLNPMDFVSALLPISKKVVRGLGISPKLLIAQAALETGWGKYPILTEQGHNSFNLFGIKSTVGWLGEQAQVLTREFKKDIQESIPIQASFRVYQNYQDAFLDYLKLIKNNPRYEKAWQVRNNDSAYLSEIQSAGYATDPEYANKINNILNSPVFEKMLKAEPNGRSDQ